MSVVPEPTLKFLSPGNLALISSALWQEIAICTAIVITLAGVGMCWRAPRYQMSIEERAKDGKLTEEQARRKIRRLAWAGPAVIIAGFLVLGVIVLR